MASTSNAGNNQLTPPAHTRNQSQADTPTSTNHNQSTLPSSPRTLHKREEFQRKVNEYSTKIREYNAYTRAKGKRNAHSNNIKATKKKFSHSHQGLLEEMLTTMEHCNAKGFIYGMVTETGKSVTGASNSLREWWKRQAMFEKTAPSQIDKYYKENSLYSNLEKEKEAKLTAELLMEISDPTLGSILSLLMQNCDPPQRKFPFEKGLPPPWWPTAQEGWWGQTGISQDEGPPPYRKPHDLRKKWKVVVLVGILKELSPNFSKPYHIVKKSGHLSIRMSAKETKFWTLALVEEAKKYCREHHGISADEAVAFLHAYGSSSVDITPTDDIQDVSVSGNEVPPFANPFGVMPWPQLAPSSNPSAWPVTAPAIYQIQQGVEVSSTLHPQMAPSRSLAQQYPLWAVSYGPMLSANVPMDAQQNRTIARFEASSSGIQDHHPHAIMYAPFVEQPAGMPSASQTLDVQNQRHE